MSTATERIGAAAAELGRPVPHRPRGGGWLPLVGVPACARMVEDHPFHIAGDKYVRALVQAVGAMPVVIPAMPGMIDPAHLLARLDGLLFPGSPSNIDPARYDGPASRPGTLHDPARDGVTLPLLRQAVAVGVPVLAICRGHQELNVALGGTLHQRVQDLPGMRDHRAPPDQPLAVQYGPAHPVRLTPGGFLAAALGSVGGPTDDPMVNSLHAQGIDRLAPGLAVEATAPDGLIEAVRVIGDGFAVGVQWHPEWRFQDHPLSLALFAAFARAISERASQAERGDRAEQGDRAGS